MDPFKTRPRRARCEARRRARDGLDANVRDALYSGWIAAVLRLDPSRVGAERAGWIVQRCMDPDEADEMVLSSDCRDSNCRNKHKYNAARSSTSSKKDRSFSSHYGSSPVRVRSISPSLPV